MYDPHAERINRAVQDEKAAGCTCRCTPWVEMDTPGRPIKIMHDNRCWLARVRAARSN